MRFRYQTVPILFSFFLFALPASTNYQMNDFGFGAGGSGVATSTNYEMTGVAGEVSGANGVGVTYNMGQGLIFTQQSNVPGAPTFTNPSSYYNKLKLVLDTGSNPSDTLFAIAVSSDNFVTTFYVQSDTTLGASPVYQTYSAWGGASGLLITGLASSTTYKAKVSAVQTKYTETAFSAASSAATVAPTLSFDIDIAPTDQETASPYTVAFGTLAVGSVTTASDKIWIDLDTNAQGGGFVYDYNSNGGLRSANVNYTITSATADLSSASEGYGFQVSTTTQSAGGPLTAVSPYNLGTQNVGVVDSTTRTILNSSAAPITAGRASIVVKAKAATTTPSAGDYADTITMIASATF